ncbi:MAG: diaminopimelate epimerase [Thermodesulfovibrionales bacterium]|nr:diaminopimelate epimerase [Thermodesulfovibrionales bacterium]MDP3111938.1 diaminopimelate epimerase [Thermodesulfovibrionales bacterium]
MKIKFTKMHGLGNDFILIDCISQAFSAQPSALSSLSKNLCNRRFGIGADQILLLYPSKNADFKMRILNADGSEVEMCGNGIRCLAKYIWDRGLSKKKVLKIETLAGIIRPEKKGRLVRVNMGEPIFEPGKIPVKISQKSEVRSQKSEKNIIIDYPLKIKDKTFKITCVSMGNPHAVIFVDNVADFPVTYYGPLLEKHKLFPKKTNVEFIESLNSSEIKMRVWERGSGETMACGTGASAAAVASNLKGLTGKNVTVRLAGGDLFIEWATNNHVYMTGPATEVFTGEINIEISGERNERKKKI